MNKILFAFAAFGAVSMAQAVTIVSGNTADTFINSVGSNANSSRNGDFQISALNATNQLWTKFSGSALKLGRRGRHPQQPLAFASAASTP